jgi:hypothetical protein
MSERKGTLTRRDFVRTGAGAAVGLSLPAAAWATLPARPARSATVTVVRDSRVLDAAHRVDSQVLGEMLAETVKRVTKTASARDGWRALVKPTDVVGLVPSKALNPTHEELVDLVRAALVDAGVAADNIRNVQNSRGKVESCTALITIPGLKAHWLTGIGTVLKNYIMFSAEPSAYHDENNDKLGEIWLMPHVKGKTRLVLVDALRPLCDKGPQVDPRYLWDYKGLLAGTDPVAVDAIGLQVIMARRQELRGEPWPLQPPPLCVAMADHRYGLGTARLDEIAVDRVGTA